MMRSTAVGILFLSLLGACKGGPEPSPLATGDGTDEIDSGAATGPAGTDPGGTSPGPVDVGGDAGSVAAPSGQCHRPQTDDQIRALVGQPCTTPNDECDSDQSGCGGCYVRCEGGVWTADGPVGDGGVKQVCLYFPPGTDC